MTDLPNTPLPAPAVVIAFLDEKAEDLDRLGKNLEAAHIADGDAQVAYDEKMDVAMMELADECEKEGKRLPRRDIMEAQARKRIGFDIYAEKVKAEKMVKAIEGRVRRVEQAVSARQSTLKGIREEQQAPQFNPGTGEVIGARR